MIKKFFVLLIGLFLVASFSVAQGATENPRIIPETETAEKNISEPVAYVNYVDGKALFKDFQKVELNMILQQGDEINTIDGRVEILLKNGGVIRLDRNTRVIFSTLNDNSIVLEIWNGNIYVRKGEMEIGVKSANTSLNLSRDEWYFTEPEKSFKHWNNEREEELSYRADTSYLPNGLERYEYALYRYGAWRYYAPYGNIWIPQVGFGWRPYFCGRWVWYPIIGWTWVSYEPFGWCVYHYGRWQWDSLFGWYWIPTRYWGPSWVYWHRWDNYWSWAPRWYNDHYYQRHRDRYTNISSNVWTTIHKDQLQSRNIAKSIVSKTELQKIPRLISRNELRTSPSSDTTIAGSISKFSKRPIQINTNSVSKSKTQAQPRKIYSPTQKVKTNSGSKSEARIIRSPEQKTFLPSPKSYSPSRSFSAPRSIFSAPRLLSRDPRSSLLSGPKVTSPRPQISRPPIQKKQIRKK